MAVRSTKQSGKKNVILPVIIGSVSLLIVIVTLLVKGTLTDDQKYFFKILFSLGCAGVAAAIPGFFQVKYKNVLSAGGALAVFLFVFRNNPVTGAGRFDYTIYLKDAKTNQVINDPALKVTLQLANDRPAGEWSERSGAYKFYNIPQEFKGLDVPVTISADKGWVVADSGMAGKVKLQDDFNDLLLIRHCELNGTVLKDSPAFAGEDSVLVALEKAPSFATYTDKAGNFSIDISKAKITAPYVVVFQKGGKTMRYNLDCGIVFTQKLITH